MGYRLTRDTVLTTDAVTGAPIEHAYVLPIYPSFSGGAYPTDRSGVARIGGFGLPRGGYGVEVRAAGYRTNSVATHPTAADHSG